MRVVPDTNIVVSALLTGTGPPSQVVRAWLERRFALVTCEQQMLELWRTLHKPHLAARLVPGQAGHLINSFKRSAQFVDSLPFVRRSSDPEDDFLLATAQGGKADFLVTGDKSGLLVLRTHEGTRIVTAGVLAEVLR